MGLSDKREAELALELMSEPQSAYNALLNAFRRAGLKITLEDENCLSAIAETPKMKSILRNSWGETVTFTITEQGPEHCLIKLRSIGKAPVGNYTNQTIFQKMRESLHQDLGVGTVQTNVQS